MIHIHDTVHLWGLVLEGPGFTRPKPLLLLTYLALEGPLLVQ
jgi:hypothetical protein